MNDKLNENLIENANFTRHNFANQSKPSNRNRIIIKIQFKNSVKLIISRKCQVSTSSAHNNLIIKKEILSPKAKRQNKSFLITHRGPS